MKTHLIVHRIPLRHQHAVDPAPHARHGGEIAQGAVKLGELVDGFVADECLADEDDLVGVVDGDELGEGAHEGLVVLHAAGGVDEDDVEVVVFGWKFV